jgi:hypothetical protein
MEMESITIVIESNESDSSENNSSGVGIGGGGGGSMNMSSPPPPSHSPCSPTSQLEYDRMNATHKTFDSRLYNSSSLSLSLSDIEENDESSISSEEGASSDVKGGFKMCQLVGDNDESSISSEEGASSDVKRGFMMCQLFESAFPDNDVNEILSDDTSISSSSSNESPLLTGNDEEVSIKSDGDGIKYDGMNASSQHQTLDFENQPQKSYSFSLLDDVEEDTSISSEEQVSKDVRGFTCCLFESDFPKNSEDVNQSLSDDLQNLKIQEGTRRAEDVAATLNLLNDWVALDAEAGGDNNNKQGGEGGLGRYHDGGVLDEQQQQRHGQKSTTEQHQQKRNDDETGCGNKQSRCVTFSEDDDVFLNNNNSSSSNNKRDSCNFVQGSSDTNDPNQSSNKDEAIKEVEVVVEDKEDRCVTCYWCWG